MDITWSDIDFKFIGQLGDLVESGFKRHFGVKDWSNTTWTRWYFKPI